MLGAKQVYIMTHKYVTKHWKQICYFYLYSKFQQMVNTMKGCTPGIFWVVHDLKPLTVLKFWAHCMMISIYGTPFPFSHPVWGESINDWMILNNLKLWYFCCFLLLSWTSCWTSNWDAVDFRCHDIHMTVMIQDCLRSLQNSVIPATIAWMNQLARCIHKASDDPKRATDWSLT